MKKYITPEIEIVSFETEDIILASGAVPKAPKTLVNGEEATGIGGIKAPDYEWN